MIEGRRVVVVQPYVPAYREPLFSSMRRQLAERGATLTVAVDRETVPRDDHTVAEVDVVLGSRLPGKVRWRPIRKLGLQHGDLVVVEQALKNLEVFPLLVSPQNRRPGVAFWGHGRFVDQSAAMARVKMAATRRGDWFFAYTKAGAQWVNAHGFAASRTTVLRNTIDGEALAQDLTAVTDGDLDRFRSELGLVEGRTALFLGGVDDTKDIDYVIAVAEAAARRLPGFTLLIAGAGERLSAVKGASGRVPSLRVIGRVEGANKALALRASSALVIPERVGLVAVDALVADLPVVTRSAHRQMPEFDYLDADLRVCAGDAATAGDFADAVVHVLNVPPDRQRAIRRVDYLRRGRCWAVEAMAARFVAGIGAWCEIR